MLVRELVLSYRPRRRLTVVTPCQPLNGPADAAEVLARLLAEESVEVFGLLCLSTRHHVLAFHEISRGSLDTTVVHPREVFKAAMLANAAAIVVGHNHPSGDPTPSGDDIALTMRLRQVGDLHGIEVLDHVVVGHDGQYYSFKESGLSPQRGPS